MIWLFGLALLMLAASAWYLARLPARAAAPVGRARHFQLLALRERLLAQLNELDQEVGDRNLDAAVAADERRRLEAELAHVLHELDAATDAAPKGREGSARRNRLWPPAVLTVVLALLAGGLYTFNSQAPLTYLAPPDEATLMAREGREMVRGLEKRLSREPNDPSGWALLGRSYAVLGRLEEARTAYARAYQLAPDDRALLADYAWFLYNQDPTNTEGLVRELYGRLYRLEPRNPHALWFLGLAAYQKGDYRKAVGYWERMLKLVPPQGNTAKELRAAIAKARAMAAGGGTPGR